MSFRGVCIGQSTNNIAEYSALIELLSDAITHGIRWLVVRLDSQLVVLQLKGTYSVRNPAIYRKFLRVKILERQFQKLKHINRLISKLCVR